jgi:hypothetical protein
VRKIICSFPRQADSHHFDALYRAGEIELELTPQGNLAERIRAAGAGIGGFFTPTGYGTLLAEGKETRLINGRHYVLESPIHADFALIKACAATAGAIWSTARPRATSARSWRWPPRSPIAQVPRWCRWASSIRKRSSRRASSSNAWCRRQHEQRYTRDQIAARVAQDIPEGAYVNLGIGLPTKVANYLPPTAKSSCTARTACWAWDPAPAPGEEDEDLINAGKQPVTLLTGGATSTTPIRSR